MAYAEKTDVPVNRTKVEIETLLAKYGAKRMATYVDHGEAAVLFEIAERRVRFRIKVPVGTDNRAAQGQRVIWRALFLSIKAKLVSVESKIETFEEAFLAHVVMPDDRTIGDATIPTIKQIYASGQMQPLLAPPAPRNG